MGGRLGAVEAGECSSCWPRRSPPQLHEVRRFDTQLERRPASGSAAADLAAVAVCARYGRIRGADEDAADERRVNVAGRARFLSSASATYQGAHAVSRPSNTTQIFALSPPSTV
jgi:hypothetical protein